MNTKVMNFFLLSLTIEIVDIKITKSKHIRHEKHDQ